MQSSRSPFYAHAASVEYRNPKLQTDTTLKLPAHNKPQSKGSQSSHYISIGVLFNNSLWDDSESG